jgi:uncharacterized protein (TIGR03083 family)
MITMCALPVHDDHRNEHDMADSTAWIRAIRGSHDRIATLLAPLSDEAVGGPSYDTEWSIAQVASHLGSQAEIFGMFLAAGLAGKQPPGAEAFHPIWDEWNNRTPAQQATDSVSANEKLVSQLEQLSESDREKFALSLFGNDLDINGLLAMRLGEHALHTWDVAVALDPTAEVAPDAVELLVDTMPVMVGRVGKAETTARTIGIETTAPQRYFVLTTGPDVVLTPGSPADGLTMPAEAFVRLVYGRLDAEHAPAELADDATVVGLRQVFPGF